MAYYFDVNSRKKVNTQLREREKGRDEIRVYKKNKPNECKQITII